MGNTPLKPPTDSPKADTRFIPTEILIDLHCQAAARAKGWVPRKEKKMTLTREELRLATPADLMHLLDDCDMDGCTVDLFGIPLCIPVRDRALLVPHAVSALKSMNLMGVGPDGEEWNNKNPQVLIEKEPERDDVDQ